MTYDDDDDYSYGDASSKPHRDDSQRDVSQRPPQSPPSSPSQPPRRPPAPPRRSPAPPGTPRDQHPPRPTGPPPPVPNGAGGRHGPEPRAEEAAITEDDYDELVAASLRPEPPLIKRVLANRGVKVLVPIAIVVLLAIIGVGVVNRMVNASGPQGHEVNLNVAPGSTLTSIAPILAEKGIVPSANGVKLWAKIKGQPKVQAGEYGFRANSSVAQAFAVLNKGPKVKTDKLTVPEGKRVAQIADLVGQLPGMSSQTFMEVASSGEIRSKFQPAEAKTLEGFLYPDTYFLSASDNERVLIQRMVNNFDNKARQFGLDNAQKTIAHSPYEALIIASLVEAEAKMPEDRGKVSQVIQNRLNQGMELRFDASVLYGIGNRKNTLTKRDLETDTPYNMHMRKGLPPTPIANPGEAAIRAALAPTPGSWLYFVVVKPDGTTAFSNTFAEHEANIRIAKQNGVVL